MEFVLKMGELKYFVVLSLALIVTFLDHALFVVLWFEKSLFFFNYYLLKPVSMCFKDDTSHCALIDVL